MKRIVLLVVVGLAAALMISTASADTLKPGTYSFTLKCGSESCQVTQIEFTLGGVVKDTATPGTPFQCTASNSSRYYYTTAVTFDDLAITYKCDENPLGLLYIAPGQLKTNTWYTLICPSSAATSTPGPTPDSNDARIKITGSVGGVQALPDVAGNADSGGSSFPYPIAGAAMGLVVIGAGGWYARRRWLS
jgi:hypothetical protein